MASKLNFLAVFAMFIVAANASAAVEVEEARAKVESGQYEAALRLLASAPDAGVQARFLRSTALAELGRNDEAIAELEALTRAHPDAPEPFNNLAALYARRGDYGSAKMALEQAIRTSDSYATVYENLSAVYIEMARSSYAKALQGVSKVPGPSLVLLTEMQGAAAAPPPAIAAAPPPASGPAPSAEAGGQPAAVPAVTEAVPVAEARPPQPEAPSEAATTSGPAPVAMRAPEPETEPKPDPAPKPATADLENNHRQAVIAALQRWAAAWSSQDVDRYLDSYGELFVPDNGISRKRWAAMRRSRLQRPTWIEVRLSDFDIRLTDGDRAVVAVQQAYRSDTYRDNTIKHFELVRQDGDWRIEVEETLKTLK